MIVQLKRGPLSDLRNFIPADGELVIDQTNKLLKVGDGMTAGGHTVASIIVSDKWQWDGKIVLHSGEVRRGRIGGWF